MTVVTRTGYVWECLIDVTTGTYQFSHFYFDASLLCGRLEGQESSSSIWGMVIGCHWLKRLDIASRWLKVWSNCFPDSDVFMTFRDQVWSFQKQFVLNFMTPMCFVKKNRSCHPQSRTKVGRRSLHATGLIDSWGVLEKMDMAKALALLRSGFLDQDDILEATSSCQLVPAPFSDQRILVSVLSKRPLIYGTTLVDILWYINNKFSYTHIFQVNICIFFIWYSKYYR